MQYQVDVDRDINAEIDPGDSLGFAVIDDVDRGDEHTTVVFTIVEPFASMWDEAFDSVFMEQFRASMEEFGDLKPDGYEITRIDDDADVVHLGD